MKGHVIVSPMKLMDGLLQRLAMGSLGRVIIVILVQRQQQMVSGLIRIVKLLLSQWTMPMATPMAVAVAAF
jgi:hypothetical protein